AQHRRDPDGPQRVAEHRDGRVRQQRCERRLVDVAPRGVEHAEVQLVAVVVVLGGGRRGGGGQVGDGEGQWQAGDARQRLGGAFGHGGLRGSVVTGGGRRRGGATLIIPRAAGKRNPEPVAGPRVARGPALPSADGDRQAPRVAVG